MSVNDDILDLMVRHQVYIQRLGGGVLRQLIPLLNRADQEIVAELRRRGEALEGSFTSRRLEALLNAIREINRDANETLGRELRAELIALAEYEAGFNRRLLSTTIPIALDIVSPSGEMLEAVVTARPFQGRLLSEWLSEFEASKTRRVRDAIRLGMVEGQSVDQIVRRVRGTKALGYRDGAIEMSRRGAEAMVRTAVSHTASAARTSLYERNSDIISKEQVVATLDTRTCTQCASLDNETFDIGKGPQTPFHIGCRCVRVPVTKSWRELGFDIDDLPPGTRASMNGQVPASLSYGEWLRRQPASVQNDALGPTRGKLFREGGLDVEKFVNRNGDEITLDQLRRIEERAFEKAGIAA